MPKWLHKLEEKTVKCKWCRTKTEMLGTKMCDACWELHHRIEMDLDLTKRMIKEIEKEVRNAKTRSVTSDKGKY